MALLTPLPSGNSTTAVLQGKADALTEFVLITHTLSLFFSLYFVS